MNMEQMGEGENEKIGLTNQTQTTLEERHHEQMGDFIVLHVDDFRKYVDDNQNTLLAFKNKSEEEEVLHFHSRFAA